MHRSIFYFEDSLEKETPCRPCTGGNVDFRDLPSSTLAKSTVTEAPTLTAPQILDHYQFMPRFILSTLGANSEAESCQVTSSTCSEKWNGNLSTNPDKRFGSGDDENGTANTPSHCRIDSPERFDLYECQPSSSIRPYNQSLMESSLDAISPTLDRINSIRYRSVSFCTGSASSSAKKACSLSVRNASMAALQNYSTCSSILESILLNQNVPEMYSSLERHDVKNSDRSMSEANPNPADIYIRPRLYSLPLPYLRLMEKTSAAYSDQSRRSESREVLSKGALNRDDHPYEPVCFSFKKRKLSFGNDCVSSQNDVELIRNDRNNSVEISSFSNSSPARKLSIKSRESTSNDSILHSLLSKTCSNTEEENNRGNRQNSDNSNFNGFSHVREVGYCNFHASGRNTKHAIRTVDSTESLQNLETLALADETRQNSKSRVSPKQRRVVIAKKMQQVVNRKVKKWLSEIAQLAAKYRDLMAVPRDDWLILLRNSFSRLLLLFMAENNFQFAVAPVATDAVMTSWRDDQEGDEEVPEKLEVPQAEIPTAQSVEDIQRFIAKCQTLKVDSKEYHCMRLITLFHSGCCHGLKRIPLVEQVNSSACKILQDLVRFTHPDDKLRYCELLLHLHSLASVNSRMVQKLFCINSSSGNSGRDGSYGPDIDEAEWMM